jgi:hypothetical protein
MVLFTMEVREGKYIVRPVDGGWGRCGSRMILGPVSPRAAEIREFCVDNE